MRRSASHRPTAGDRDRGSPDGPAGDRDDRDRGSPDGPALLLDSETGHGRSRWSDSVQVASNLLEPVSRPSPSIARVRPSLESAPKKSLTVEPAPKKSLTTEFVLRPPAPKKSLSAHLATPRQPIRPWINSEVWDAYGNPDINHYGGKVSLFFRLFVRSFACLIVHSFIYSFIRSLIYLLIHSILRSFLHSFIPSFIHSFLRSFILLGGEGSDTRGGYGGDGRGGNPLRRSWWRGGQPFIRDEVNSA